MKACDVRLDTDLWQQVATRFIPGQTLIVLPSESACRIVQHDFQSRLSLYGGQFISLREWSTPLSQIPVTAGQQRQLLLFAALPDDLRTAWRLDDFFQARTTIRDFIQFWSELRRQGHRPEDALDDELPDSVRTGQNEIIAGYRRWLEAYRDRLRDANLDDLLFLPEMPASVEQWAVSPRHRPAVHLVLPGEDPEFVENLAKAWERDGGEATIWRQPLPNHPEFVTLRRLRVFRASDALSLTDRFLRETAAGETALAADPMLEHEVSRYWLPAEHYTFDRRPRYADTGIYHYLNAWQILLSGIPAESPNLLDITALAKVVRTPEFFQSHIPNGRDALEAMIRKQIDEDNTLWVETDFDSLRTGGEAARELTALAEILQEWRQCLTATDLERRLRALPSALPGTEEEWERLWEAADATLAIQRLLGEDTWRSLLGPNTLRWFLDYLSGIHLTYPTVPAPCKFIDLDDAWAADPSLPLHLLNIQEGIVPRRGATGFPWTSAQRRKLQIADAAGERAVQRECFLQMALSRRELTIYVQESPETEPSGFVAELIAWAEALRIPLAEATEPALERMSLYRQVCGFDTALTNLPDDAPDYVPLVEETDFPEHTVTISPSGLAALRKHPAEYYLRNVLRMLPTAENEPDGFSPLVLGRLFHDLMRRLALLGNSPCRETVEQHLSELLRDPYRRSLPLRASGIYFRKIVAPMLVDAVMTFFRELRPALHLPEEAPLRFSPERDRENRSRNLYETPDMTIILKGRPDVIIENGTDKAIIDYKLGKSKDLETADAGMQLRIYEYILQQTGISLFYSVQDSRFVPRKEDDLPLLEIVKPILDKVISSCRYPAKTAANSAYTALFNFDRNVPEDDSDETTDDGGSE